MQTLPYTVIKNKIQYNRYCDQLEKLVDSNKKSKAILDEIELLTLLIEKFDSEHTSFGELDPIALLKSLLKENGVKAVELSNLLNVSKGLVSDILNYKKGLSKQSIRILANRFKLNQEAFNRPYQLKSERAQMNTLKRRQTKRLKTGSI